jgi:putative ABC transport system ATP-binding protein
MALIQLTDVSRVYGNGALTVTALHPITLGLEQGEFACVCGPSGSGKSTLLNLMGAIDTPSTGSVSINGRSTAGLSRGELARLRLQQIGFVFQAHNLLPVLTAFENVEYTLLLKGMPAAERRRLVTETLENVGLGPLAGKLPGELSGGQQQRVAVARAIVASPDLVLADEPTASLDSTSGRELLDLLTLLNRQQGMTFVFSSHDPRVVSRAGRVITLEDGRIASDRHQHAALQPTFR